MEAKIRLPKPAANATQYAIGERNKGDEGQYHCANGDRQLNAGLRALRGGHDDIGGLFFAVVIYGHWLIIGMRVGQCRVAFTDRHRRDVRHHQLGHQYAAGSRHECGGKQIINADAH